MMSWSRKDSQQVDKTCMKASQFLGLSLFQFSLEEKGPVAHPPVTGTYAYQATNLDKRFGIGVKKAGMPLWLAVSQPKNERFLFLRDTARAKHPVPEREGYDKILVPMVWGGAVMNLVLSWAEENMAEYRSKGQPDVGVPQVAAEDVEDPHCRIDVQNRDHVRLLQ